MTTEEKAKHYDELLDKAKQIYNKENDVLIMHTIEDLFPQLKESEDERIRESLLEYLHTLPNHYAHSGVCALEWIAWLEKQGDTNETIDMDEFAQGVLKGAAISLITWIDYNAAEGNMCLSNMECKDIEDALVSGNWDKIYAYIKKKLEKQGKKPQGKTALEAIKEEKVDNANKIEPKFKVGDWIVNNIKKDTFFIKSITQGYFTLEDTKGNIYSPCLPTTEYYHLWTIQDAKEGDVLSDDYGIYIFGEHDYLDKECFFCVGAYQYSEKVYENEHLLCSKINAHPATKEQRDTLMKVMTDAGYTFDFEKKELKKIEQKPVEWSEEDEERIKQICDDLKCGLENFRSGKNVKGLHFEKIIKSNIDWLKSLRLQSQWKPSDEQMEALESATENCAYSEYQDCLRELIGQLKKLREE